MKRIIVIAVCLALLLAGVVIYRTVTHQPAKTSLLLSGTIEVTAVEASFRIPGRVKERRVDEGDTVQSGQVLALLETDDLDREVRQRQADLATAKAVLAELTAGSRQEEIAQAAATVTRLQAEATRAASDLVRQEGLFREEVISARDIEASRAASQAAHAALAESQERLRQTKNGPRPETLQQARSRVESAAAAAALVQNQMGHATLRAPANGIVLAKHIEPGEQVMAGTPVVTLGQLDEVWVRGYIPETDLGRVQIGQQAQVTVDTYPARVFPGKVTFIAQEAEFTPKNVQTAKERVKLVYRIKITLKNPGHELKPGMPADATITF